MPAVAGAGVLAVVIVAGLSGRGGATSADTVPTTAPVAVAATGVGLTGPPIVVDTDSGIVKTALTHGLQEIFFWSAVIMSASVLLHIFLKGVPLRVRAAPEVAAEADAATAAAALH